MSTELPPLPEPAMEDVPSELWGQNISYPALYTAEQMRAYAEQVRAAERQRWRAFTAHCQRVTAALKNRMTAEQVVEHLGAEIDARIQRLASRDTSDIDPDLVEWALRILESNAYPSKSANSSGDGLK